MNGYLESILAFTAILNPFALSLYLLGVMDDLERRQFFRVLARASVMSLAAFWLCALGGEPILRHGFGVSMPALRAFGGLIFLVIAYKYTLHGYHAAEAFRGSLDELPSAIALPYMIGAGTITQAIIIGRNHHWLVTLGMILAAVAICFVIVTTFYVIRELLRRKREHVFRRYVNLLARLNGLLIGAIAVKMIFTGIQALWASP
ncbi:MAG: MarC family protein [Phycisphaerae bacterium]|nr:MarC family protein [Phycisphaerae bacterium]